jgi:photoactive yellow protein
MGFFSKLKRFFGLEEIAYIPPQPAGMPTTAPGLTVLKNAPGAPSATEAASAGDRSAALAFVPAEFLENLPKMSASQLDALDFGCVKVSDEGKVIQYNRWESEFASVPQKDAIGKNFFRELAPCTNNRLVFGKFKDGVSAGSLDTVLSYAFTYKMRPTLVKVHLYRHPRTMTNWVLVKRAGGI